jgi:hypothetical protein
VLEPYIAQMAELVELNEQLTALRLEFIHRAQAQDGSALWNNEAEARTREIAERARVKYSGAEWLSRFPPESQETDPMVSGIMLSSRNMAVETCVLLHKLIMQIPVVGCGEGDS